MSRLTEADVIALAAAVAGEGGGGGTGDGDMKKSVYDADETVKDAGGIGSFVDDKLSSYTPTTNLGDLALKDDVDATYTPQGSVSVSQGTDTTTTVNSITAVGTLPSMSVSGEKLTFNAGTLPTKGSDTTVVTASGTRMATFSGTQATITST